MRRNNRTAILFFSLHSKHSLDQSHTQYFIVLNSTSPDRPVNSHDDLLLRRPPLPSSVGTQPQLPLRLRPCFRPPRCTSRGRYPGRRRSGTRRTPTPRASVHRFFCSFSGPFCPTTPAYERCPSMSARQERVHHRQAVHDVHRLVRAFVGRYLLDNEAVLCA